MWSAVERGSYYPVMGKPLKLNQNHIFVGSAKNKLFSFNFRSSHPAGAHVARTRTIELGAVDVSIVR